MCHKLIVLIELPRLAPFGFYFQELCIRVLEHLLVLGVPFVSESSVACRKDVAGLTDCCLPEDRVAVAQWAGIDVRVPHLGNKLILHGYLQVGACVEH